MGRGLAALFAASEEGEPARQELRELAVELIEPNPNQPRRDFDAGSLQDLAGSLAERGILQPVLVRPRPGGTYELVAGERRWRAAKIAGLATVPALVRDGDDAQALELALIENMAREDLNPVEEARACAALVEELGLTREEVGRRVGRSRVAVSNLMRLLDLPDEALGAMQRGDLTEGHGRALLLADDHGARRRLARDAVEAGWSVRVLEQRARAACAGVTDHAARAKGGTHVPHPDQEAAAAEIARTLSAALGREVRVRPRRDGYTVELTVEGPDDAAALARYHPRTHGAISSVG